MPIVSAIRRYDAGSIFDPIVVSKYPEKRALRSPCVLFAKSIFCASTEPDEYT